MRTIKRFLGSFLLSSVLHFLLFTWMADSVLTRSALARDNEPFSVADFDVTEMSLEQLMGIEVFSVSKKIQKLSETASAVHVITSEDIRRSGAVSILEALRMAPGLQVAKINSNIYAITSRGFIDKYSNKLLVLIDGRSVYTPLYGGVYWDVQDTMLEDIDRIEVIRGPGATVWGANAVNGIINIITKNSKDTQGTLAVAGGGTEGNGFGALRYGSKLGDGAHYRVYTKYFQRDGGVNENGQDMEDDWDAFRGGFRVDWDKSESDRFTLQGDAYDGTSGQNLTTGRDFRRTFDDDMDVSGGNILARWSYDSSDDTKTTFQAYYDRAERNEEVLGQTHNTYDLELQNQFRLTGRQEIVWGLGYRYIHHDIEGTDVVNYFRGSRGDNLYSAFIQDDISLVTDRLRLTIGSKFEQNDYTGTEIQPSARLLWTPDERNSLWAAVSRATATPSRTQNDIVITTPVIVIKGNEDYESEKLMAYEFGWRAAPAESLTIDMTAFYHRYDDLMALELQGRPGPPPIITRFENGMEGDSRGVEIFSQWRAVPGWTLAAGYAYIIMDITARAPVSGSDNWTMNAKFLEGNTPQSQFQLRSSHNLPYRLEFDAALYYVGELKSLDIPAYTRLDLRLGWKPVNGLDLSIVGQNLLEDQHKEFGFTSGINQTEVQRSVYGKIAWRL